MTNTEQEFVICDCCGNSQSTEIFKAHDWNFQVPGQFGIVRCLSCDLVYLNPRPLPEALADYYPSGYYTHEPRTKLSPKKKKLEKNRVKQALKNCAMRYYSPKVTGLKKSICKVVMGIGKKFLINQQRWGLLDVEGRLLDVGCGGGSFLEFLESDWLIDSRFVTTGVDIDSDAIAVARSRGIDARFHQFPDTPFIQKDFDVITMRHSLEHMLSPRMAIKEIHRLLRPGGRFVVEVPNFRSMGPKLVSDRWSGLDAPRHLYHFEPETLKRVLQEAGFEVLHVQLWPGTYKSDLTLANLERRYKSSGKPKFTHKVKMLLWELVFKVLDFFVRGGSMSVAARKPIN